MNWIRALNLSALNVVKKRFGPGFLINCKKKMLSRNSHIGSLWAIGALDVTSEFW